MSSLVYAGRSAATMPFAGELRASYGERVRIVATAEQGRPDLAALAAETLPGTLVYCCGPASMPAAAEAAFPAERLRAERFRPAPKTFGPDTEFEAVCARSARTVRVPADKTLLDALAHAGHPLPSGCREGVCGSCELTVLDGRPGHRDDVGAPEGRMYACVSRALTPPRPGPVTRRAPGSLFPHGRRTCSPAGAGGSSAGSSKLVPGNGRRRRGAGPPVGHGRAGTGTPAGPAVAPAVTPAAFPGPHSGRSIRTPRCSPCRGRAR
ncbi:2Fe-2S iron-sulfur cluster binding domain-containing protein [Streptomyces sp. 2224.1]|nr:2Fe-2S iron-sulfur cluster binding domain-containing protein [Streptomyces sp. 2224.1]